MLTLSTDRLLFQADKDKTSDRIFWMFLIQCFLLSLICPNKQCFTCICGVRYHIPFWWKMFRQWDSFFGERDFLNIGVLIEICMYSFEFPSSLRVSLGPPEYFWAVKSEQKRCLSLRDWRLSRLGAPVLHSPGSSIASWSQRTSLQAGGPVSISGH